MGYNTNITICNDNFSDYKKRPDKFLDVVDEYMRTGGDSWGITVLPTDHADATQLIAAGGNFATKLYTGYYCGSHHTETGQVALLRQWAESLGYRLVAREPSRSK